MAVLSEELYQIWCGIAPDAMAAMEADEAEDADYLAESLLTVVDTYLPTVLLDEWKALTSDQRMRMALDTVTS